MSRCMSCCLCMEVCPQFTAATGFVGAAIINQVRLFNQHPTGAVLKRDRLEAMTGNGGIHECSYAQNCVRICPNAFDNLIWPRLDTHIWPHLINKDGCPVRQSSSGFSQDGVQGKEQHSFLPLRGAVKPRYNLFLPYLQGSAEAIRLGAGLDDVPGLIRSSSALQSRGFGNTWVHSENEGSWSGSGPPARRARRSPGTGTRPRCRPAGRSRPRRGDQVVAHPAGQDAPHRVCCLASTSSLTRVAAVVKRTRRFCRQAATHSPVAKWVLPVPHSPINTTGSARSM